MNILKAFDEFYKAKHMIPNCKIQIWPLKTFFLRLHGKLKRTKGVQLYVLFFLLFLYLYFLLILKRMAVRNISIHHTNYACDYWYERAITVFTILYSLYITIVMFIVGCVICYFLLENMELIKLIKRKSINSFSKPNLNLQKIPLVRKASS